MSGLSMGVKKFHSYALVLLMLFSIAAPLSDVIRLQSPSLEFEDNSQKQGTVGFSNGTGSQYLTGTQTINGIEWEVQPQTTLERHAWLQLHNSTADDFAVKEGLSVTLDDFGQVHACWRQHDSTNSTNYSLWSATLNDSGLVESTRVSDSGNPGISCDMAIDLRGNERMAWINADDNSVSIGRQVSPSQLDSHRTFHNRTVMNNQPADSLQIVIDEDAKETIIWRHANSHKLWVTGFTGSFWTTWKLLDSAVGQEFTATVDDSGTIGVVYLNIASDEIRLLEFSDSTDITVKVLEQGESAGSVIDVDQDQRGNEQVLYTLKDNGGTARLLRNLAGKDTGRIDTTALWTVPTISQGDQGLQVISDSDLNGDGYSDLIWSEPLSESGGNVTGMVAIHYGSSAGLNSTPDTILNGTFANERFGFGLAACDIDGDGFDELAIGRPGAGSANTGAVVIYSGGLNGISVNPVWNYYGRGHDNETGWGLECAGDLNADNYQDLLISSRGANTTADGSGSVTAEHFGIVDLFYGSAAGLASTPDWTVNGTTIDSYLGTEMVGGGDFNGDGYDDIAISATGTLAAYMGYSEVILWAGSEFGLNSEPNRRLISNVQGRLFGYSMAWSDVNGDGLDDLAIGEPFNSSNGYQSGKVWLYHGVVDANLTTLPAWTYAPFTNGVLAGIEITAADDVNEDGYEDLIITMGGTTSNGGAVELWLGSDLGLGSTGQLIASGNQGEHSGWLVSSGGDANGDGMSEIAFSHRQVEDVSTWDASISLLTEQDWESLDFQIGGNIIDTDLGVGPEGESIILITNQTDGITYSTMMRQDRDGSAVPIWVSTELIATPNSLETELIVDEGGRAWVMMLSEIPQGGHILEVYRPELSWVSMTNILAQTGDIGSYPALAVDSQDLMHIAFYDKSSSRLWYSVESSSGWTTENVRSQFEISSAMTIAVGLNYTELVYRLDTDNKLYSATNSGGTWSESSLGETLISDHERVELANGSHFLSTWNLSGNSTFGLMPSDANESNFITIPLNISANSTFAASQIPNGSLLVTWVNSSGEGGVLTNLQNGNWTMLEAWNSTNSTAAGLSLNQLGNTTYLSLYNDAERGDFHAWWYNNSSLSHIVNQSEVIAITSSDIAGGFIPNGVQAITHRNSEFIANISAFEVYSQSASYLMRTSDGALSFVDHSTFDSTPAQLGISTSSGPFGYAQTSDGGLRIAVYDSLNHDLLVYRLEADSDGDNIPDFDDGLPLVTSQWLDQDGDGWGDNPDGQSPDSCPSDAGDSIFVDFGCPDFDGDGWADTLESAGCNGEIGISFIDRTGCRDWDSDGWSNNGNNWVKGDAYMSNWKQTKESDGDTRGDNHGPDCCDTFHPSTGYTHQSEPDPFPFNFHQWFDTDGDGFGDNFSHESGDQCVYIYGTSEYDRPGCDDSDGDGYSDPVEGVWGVEQGADIWPDDGSQWRDSDGDGHGDNSSDDATNPDKFPNSSIAAIDDDNDGHPDTWTHLYNGSNSTGGLILDACPGVGGYGESFRDRYGCPDSDGDGASDLGDPFPLESSQWQDTDEDGFGDNPVGVLGDICPTIFGFYNGTSGVGCPIINANDDDLDGVINDDDNCPETPALEVVNFAGCSDSQLDDDLDGVVNSLDSCPDTIGGATVDEIGCSQVQSESDSDDDGVLDPADKCADTVNGSQVDNNGCSAEQRDSDNDGVSDSDDNCPNTPLGAATDQDGCIVAGVDSDQDGWDDIDDPFPADSTQWADGDNDGYGDNSTGLNADRCPTANGSSSQDRLGCPDTDDDGWSDPDLPSVGTWGVSSGADAFIDDSTQWKDADGDGFGDNISGNLGDQCPNTDFGWLDKIDGNGCAPNQIDSDSDGISDISDSCPTEFGPMVNNGCPLAGNSGDGADAEDGLFGISMMTLGIAGGVIFGVMMLVIVVMILLRSDDDWDDDDWDDDDDDDYDDDDDDDDDDDFMSSFGSKAKQSKPDKAKSRAGPKSGPSGGPSGGPPSRSTGGPSGGPPSRGPSSGPSSGPSGAPSGNPPSLSPQQGANVSTGAVKRATKKAVGASSETSNGVAKVRKTRTSQKSVSQEASPPWMKDTTSLFSESDESNKKDSVSWAWDEIQASTPERSILMQLQESGWSVEQSRAIIDEASNY